MRTPDSGKRYDLSPVTVLVVEDNDQMRRLVEHMLRGFGVRNIVAVRDGPEALQRLDELHVDLVITDWAMQPIDGLDFVRRIRFAVNCGYRMVPILMLSGYSEEWRVTAARDAGVNEYLVKPITATRLLQRVLHMIEQPRPFVRTNTYFGPDRRRNLRTPYAGVERRHLDLDASGAPPGGLTEAEVEALLRG